MVFRAWRSYGSVVVFSVWLSACADAHDIIAAPTPPDHASPSAGAAAVTQAGPVESKNLCAQLADSQCQAEQRCCTAPGRALEACKTARAGECEQGSHLDSVATSPLTGFDATAADSVFAQLQAKLQACDPEVVRWSTSQEGLRSLFKGSVASGQSCKPATVINADMSQQAAALLSCMDASRTACLPASLLGEWTCTGKSERGGSCVTDDNCQADAYCVVTSQAVFGTCAERLALGMVCSGPTQCQSFSCSHGTCSAPDKQVAFCPTAEG